MNFDEIKRASSLHSSRKNQDYVEDALACAVKLIEELQERDHRLACLEEAGVDNWCGYEMAQDIARTYVEEEMRCHFCGLLGHIWLQYKGYPNYMICIHCLKEQNDWTN